MKIGTYDGSGDVVLSDIVAWTVQKVPRVVPVEGK